MPVTKGTQRYRIWKQAVYIGLRMMCLIFLGFLRNQKAKLYLQHYNGLVGQIDEEIP